MQASITLDKQFLTIGINGMAEAAESQGIKVGYNDDYINFVQGRLKTIFEANQAASKHYGVKFNTEFVPRRKPRREKRQMGQSRRLQSQPRMLQLLFLRRRRRRNQRARQIPAARQRTGGLARRRLRART